MNKNGNHLILAIDLNIRIRGLNQRQLVLSIVKWLLAIVLLGFQTYRALRLHI